jgi:hypothetical protein
MTIADDQSTEMSPDALDRVYDRRRPGPRSDVHPYLLPVYRGIVPDADADADEDDDEEALNPARGVLFGLILAVPCWGTVVAGVGGSFDDGQIEAPDRQSPRLEAEYNNGLAGGDAPRRRTVRMIGVLAAAPGIVARGRAGAPRAHRLGKVAADAARPGTR